MGVRRVRFADLIEGGEGASVVTASGLTFFQPKDDDATAISLLLCFCGFCGGVFRADSRKVSKAQGRKDLIISHDILTTRNISSSMKSSNFVSFFQIAFERKILARN